MAIIEDEIKYKIIQWYITNPGINLDYFINDCLVSNISYRATKYKQKIILKH